MLPLEERDVEPLDREARLMEQRVEEREVDRVDVVRVEVVGGEVPARRGGGSACASRSRRSASASGAARRWASRGSGSRRARGRGRSRRRRGSRSGRCSATSQRTTRSKAPLGVRQRPRQVDVRVDRDLGGRGSGAEALRRACSRRRGSACPRTVQPSRASAAAISPRPAERSSTRRRGYPGSRRAAAEDRVEDVRLRHGRQRPGGSRSAPPM